MHTGVLLLCPLLSMRVFAGQLPRWAKACWGFTDTTAPSHSWVPGIPPVHWVWGVYTPALVVATGLGLLKS